MINFHAMWLKYIIILAFLVIPFKFIAQETNWNIPKDANEKTAPFLFKDSIRKAGESIFMQNCKSCHGEPGKANFSKLSPIPKDPASPEYQSHTDGALFYIITNGRGVMPSFQNTLSDEQRWYVISFVRSFNRNYIQAAPKTEVTSDITSSISLSISFDQGSGSVITSILDKTNESSVSVTNIPVRLFVKCTFGNLPIGQANTNEKGQAFIKFPSDVPGDSDGNITFIAIAGTKDKQIKLEKNEKIGVASIQPKLLDQRAWWNVRSMAPLWLIITYVCCGIAVACTVIFVFRQLKTIKDNNKFSDQDYE